jgi:cleavage stimulation factor subunit 2
MFLYLNSLCLLQAALIMQVLQLTDQQIAMLPPEQRQSILILKDQLTKSQ